MVNKTQRCRTTRNTYLELTPGELLVIWRKRQGWTQAIAARDCRVSLHNYRLAEYDRNPQFDYRDWLGAPMGDLTPHEECLIRRLHAKKTQHEIAKEIGLCRNAMRAQETGETPCTKLLEFWDKRSNA